MAPLKLDTPKSVLFGGLYLPNVEKPKWGTQPAKLGFVNFNSFTPTDVEKFSEFNGEIIF